MKGIGRRPLCFGRTMGISCAHYPKNLASVSFFPLCSLYFTDLQSTRLSPLASCISQTLQFHWTNPVTEHNLLNEVYFVFDIVCLEKSVQSWSGDIKRWSSQGFVSERNHFHSLTTVFLLAPLTCFSTRLHNRAAHSWYFMVSSVSRICCNILRDRFS